MKRQVVIIADMEGASGIFGNNSNAFVPGTDEWKTYGRACITSDFFAVCAALKTCGIDDIFVYDEHYAGDRAGCLQFFGSEIYSEHRVCRFS